jgi:hypothetical protein
MERKLQRPHRIVSRLAGNTNSVFCEGHTWPETANGCLVLHRAGTIAERHNCRAEDLKNLFHASAERIRRHLKTTAKSAWELAGWLTHAQGATRQDATFVLDATHTVLAGFGSAVIRHESHGPEQCPKCGSYKLDVGFNPELMPRPYVYECEECGWQSPEMRMPHRSPGQKGE